MFCEKCGKRIDDDSKFCPYCGTRTETIKAISPKGKDTVAESASVNLPEPPATVEKFCSKCGALLSEDMMFCGNCGAPVEQETFKPMASAPTKVGHIHIRLKKASAIIMLLVLVVVAVVSFIVVQYTGYNGLTKQVMSAYIDYDIDKILNVVGDMYYTGSKKSAENHFKSIVGDGLDQLEAIAGPGARITYKINDTYDMSNRKLEDLLDDIASRYQAYDTDAITKVVVADVTVTAKSKEDEAEIQLNLIICKENGSYHLYEIE